MSNGNLWTPAIWTQFNGDPQNLKQTPGLLRTTMGPMQVTQQVFPTIVTGNDNSIPADTVDLATGNPSTGVTRAFATIRKSFTLFPVHISDPALTMMTNQVNLAGQAAAIVSEGLVHQGTAFSLPGGGQSVNMPAGDQAKLDTGLLGIAANNKVISVAPRKDGTYKLATFRAVVQGISQFTIDQQGPPYGLILSPDIFADVNLPLEDEALVTPYSAILAILASGPLVMSPGLPSKTGLLAALGGKATTLYIGTGPLVEFNANLDSVYSFTARESIQFLNIEPRSLIRVEFKEA